MPLEVYKQMLRFTMKLFSRISMRFRNWAVSQPTCICWKRLLSLILGYLLHFSNSTRQLFCFPYTDAISTEDPFHGAFLHGKHLCFMRKWKWSVLAKRQKEQKIFS